MADTPPPTVWPCLNYTDAPAAIDFLVEAFGFEERLVVRGEDEGRTADVVHAELAWPPGGGVMLGSQDRHDNEFAARPTGTASLYCVTDEPDALLERANRAGAETVRGLVDEDYGSRGFTVKDLEGNLWSFGTYRGS